MSWFERIPKTELHLHLEGAIPYTALWELIEKYGGEPSVPDLGALRDRFAYRDFAHFLDTWVWKNQFLREYEDFAFIAQAVAHDLARQNIRYAEIFFSPSDFARYGLQPQGIAQSIFEGLSAVPEVSARLIADLVRDSGPQGAARTLAEVHEVQNLGVVGIGLGGAEHRFPPEQFGPVYEAARRFGFHTTAHAGEAAGAGSIWGALRSLQAERIGHATRASEDPALLDQLMERQIPLEMCPLSNVRTGVAPSLEQHPVRRYFDAGLHVTVNTDDPKMFGNSMADEFRALVQVHGFTRDEIRKLILNGIQASWMSDAEKQNMTEVFRRNYAWAD